MRRRAIRKLSSEQLDALPTKLLLARLKQLHQCEQSAALSDSPAKITPGKLFKDTAEWVEELKRVYVNASTFRKSESLLTRGN